MTGGSDAGGGDDPDGEDESDVHDGADCGEGDHDAGVEEGSHAEEDGHGDDEDAGGHGALPPEDLRYPEFVFESGDVASDGAFDLRRDLDREEMADWLQDLAGGLASHDVAVESPDGYVTFGVGAEDVAMSFDPGEDVGELSVTFSLRAKPMFVADDPDGRKVGARGGRGFVPVEMLTGERETFRCYNWIDDPDAEGDEG
ncbi:hypothetical protein [Halomicrococcus sp. NG-SE-24]|uniref:hypothetical protein n=1 Tax=Halomicrococcus sp. NG-SE-24 TaxID=3436928 RepID=UPI003D95DC53